MKILLATTNPGKKKNMISFLRGVSGVSWLSLEDFPEKIGKNHPEEHGKTFKENALIKAVYYGQKTGEITLAEDAGLFLEAFPEKFGIKTRREIDAENDNDWLRIFLELMDQKTNRKAHFYSAMALFDPKNDTIFVCEGKTSGIIIDFPAAPLEKGIPVSSVFLPDGKKDVYSALSATEKAKITHRGKAAQKMKHFLQYYVLKST